MVRERHNALVRAADRLTATPLQSTVRRLVQIFDGGSMPTSPDHFFLSYPVEVGGSEIEGGSSSQQADTSQTIPVVVLGQAPSPGDLLTAYAVGGRWVAERGSGTSGNLSCYPCALPRQNLTVSWVNTISGNGQTILAYSAVPPSWTSGCSKGLQYKLLCTGGQLEFRVIYWTTGACPDLTTSQYCSNLRGTPFGLTLLSGYSCMPLNLTFMVSVSTCPAVSAAGYQSFTVTV
jgi:hypothetical protein